ncbi:MAG: CHAP domain-containing protein [Oscillospiraceae bacterium]|jgi:hypothetical protein|nr:CHAP domain-containing protein [Oscillospiraceae bacterium]
MGQVQDLIKIAESYVGIKENPPNSNNVVFNTAYYRKNVVGDNYPWCAVFVWYCFQALGVDGLFPRTASCQTILDAAKMLKQAVAPPEIRAGDVILYKFKTTRNNNAANHVGIVIDTDDNYFYTVEGNTSVSSDDDGGAVMKRKRLRTMPEIVGAYRPKYKEDEEMTQDEFNVMFEKAFATYNQKIAKQPPHDWAKDTWARVCAYDTSKGQKLFDGTNPQGDASREQLAALFERLGLLK